MNFNCENQVTQKRWIGRDLPGLTFQSEIMPAPYFRCEFECPKNFASAIVRYSAPGYCDLKLDGEAISDAVLAPTVSIFDKRIRFLEFDIKKFLRPGEKQVWSAILGNGWYNCPTSEVWHFDKASWRDWPKLMFELEIDGQIVLTGDRNWQILTGGLLFDSLRNGELFDANLEPKNWRFTTFDGSNWEHPVFVAPPGGVMTRQIAPCCSIRQRITPKTIEKNDNKITVDFGKNLTGWCEIKIKAVKNAKFVIHYIERMDKHNKPHDEHQTRLGQYTLSGEFQTDTYIASGDEKSECWHPRFTYHGFRYVVIELTEPNSELCSIEAHFITSNLQQTGDYRSDHVDFEKLRQCAIRSYLSNFTGIPTDCPQREKNGWTGDALLAAESGLYLFNACDSYIEWLETLCDSQRPSGQLPAIAPSSGWGFNGCSGPAWDSVLILLPWSIYLHSGKLEVLRKFYPFMTKYLDYCALREEQDHLLDFGLGDWCAPNNIMGNVDRCFSSSAYYVHDLNIVSQIASLLELSDDSTKWHAKNQQVKNAFRARFHRTTSQWGNNTMTELAMALEMNLVENVESEMTAKLLAEVATSTSYHAEFGILGAKYVPRALFKHGYINAAWRIYTQEDYPGWVNWLNMGATTLLENWEGSQSWNHIMFGDFVATTMEYLGGIRLTPKFIKTGLLHIEPCFPDGLNELKVSCQTARGQVECYWKRLEKSIEIIVSLPENCEVNIYLPNRQIINQTNRVTKINY